MKNLISGVLCLALVSCISNKKPESSVIADDRIEWPEKPNILWLVAEDMSPVIESFGDSTIKTPHLNRLAKEGVRYTNVYSTAGVCAPSRAAIATGMYPAAVGTNHMRTSGNPKYLSEGIIRYSAVLPPAVKMHSEYLRKAGYYCTNRAKQDYQFKAPVTAWDESSKTAHWRNRAKDQPFFAIFNFEVCHESGMWKNKDHELLANPEDVIVPPYYPDNAVVRNELARMYSNIVEMDRQVGEILQQLEDDGLLESTIIFWYTDHGGPLPRQKREIYDSGIRVPMIIRFPEKAMAGSVSEELISFIDLKPTLLSLADIPIPDYLHGQAFLGRQKAKKERVYIHAARDRLDTVYDRVRAVRDKRFKYIKNYYPDRPNIMDITYRKNMKLMQELYRLHELGRLEGPQKLFFNRTKPKEELYDCLADPYEINNLAQDSTYRDVLERLRQQHLNWVATYGDKGAISERALIQEMWPNYIQPETQAPEILKNAQEIEVSCATEGASIAYRIKTDHEDHKVWQVYQAPISNPRKGTFEVMAHRIGYKESEVVEMKLQED